MPQLHLHIKLSRKMFVKLSGTPLPCGSYRVYVTIMGSTWLLRGLYGNFRVYVAVTRSLWSLLYKGCHIHPVTAKYILQRLQCPRRPRNCYEIATPYSISWKLPRGFYGTALREGVTVVKKCILLQCWVILNSSSFSLNITLLLVHCSVSWAKG